MPFLSRLNRRSFKFVGGRRSFLPDATSLGARLRLAGEMLETRRMLAVVGQVDDFEDGTTMNWREGGPSPNAPQNVAGGPTGSTRALTNTSTGIGRGGSKLIQFNTEQWSGSYAGIAAIQADLRNLGNTTLFMRLALEGSAFQRYGSTEAVELPPGGDWQTVSFGVTPADLTAIGGTSQTAEQVLANVSELRILAAESAPRWNGDTIAAELGLDNIVALGDPPTVEFSQQSYSVGEDGTPVGATVTLERTGSPSALSLSTTVQVSLADGTATGGPGGGPTTDYDNDPIQIVFSAGQSSASVIVPITQDTDPEADETLQMEVLSVSNAIIGGQNTSTLTIEDDEPAPTVLEVKVSSTSWTTPFKEHVDPPDAVGYSAPTTAATTAMAMPWSNINQIVLIFSQPVQGIEGAPLEPTDFELNSGDPEVPLPTITSVAQDPAGTHVILTFSAALPSNRYSVVGKSDRIFNLAGESLDGEFGNKEVSLALPSGDGSAGGDFVFYFNVLRAGYSADDFFVNVIDFFALAGGFSTTAGVDENYSPFVDGNGDSFINVLDFFILADFFSSTLTSLMPLPPPPGDAYLRIADQIFQEMGEQEEERGAHSGQVVPAAISPAIQRIRR